MNPTPGPLLQKISNPNDLRKLSEEDLQLVCQELRQYIIDVVSARPGHLGASLGVVELTVAPPDIAAHGETGEKIGRGKFELVPTMTVQVRDI